ncbi:MAG: DUF4157 domain-containing protein [Candidatus Methanoperedens sp.]|nr:DUF4157 domain-containing protein [Candidatus Methanoperedens sp.]
MNMQLQAHLKSTSASTSGFMQRKCVGDEGSERRKEKRFGLQTKLTVNKPGDIYEQEADRTADQVLAAPAHPGVTGAAPCIQRFSGQSNRQMDAAPASVVRVLAGSGRALEPALRQDMEQRFGHDFSLVRVHSGFAAEQSAREVNASAYTVGHNIVFGEGRFSPETNEGRRLIAHELAHVVQQESNRVSSLQRKKDDEKVTASGSCGGKSLASSIGPSEKRLNGTAVKPTLDAEDFGITSKLGADFKFGACKVGTTWRFQLDALVIPIASKVQAATFRKNVGAASDSVVTKKDYPAIVHDLSPTRTGTFSVSCGGKSFKDKVTTYSIRKTYWNHKFVIDHEAFHRKDWTDMYRKELVKAESNVWAHSLPASEAKDASAAVAKANAALTKYMTDAYQRLCDAFGPKKESRAYDAGAPAYQKIVDDINARVKKEKW